MTRLPAVQTSIPSKVKGVPPSQAKTPAAVVAPKPTPHSSFEQTPRLGGENQKKFEKLAPSRGDLQKVPGVGVGVATNVGIAVKSPGEKLLAEGQKALAAGDYAAAKKAFTAMKSAPGAADLTKHLGVPDAGGKWIEHNKGGNETKITPFVSEKNSDVADRGLAQTEQLKQMSEVLGHKADPNNMQDMKKYFQEFSKKKSTAEVSQEFGKYTTNFFAHAGEGGVNWDPKTPARDRPAKMGELLANQPSDSSGRKIIDCEGFTYLAGAVLGDVKDAKGGKRFDVIYVADGNHQVAYVYDNAVPLSKNPYDKNNKPARFTVDNDKTILEGNQVAPKDRIQTVQQLYLGKAVGRDPVDGPKEG